MAIPFMYLRDALAQLSLSAPEQRKTLAGTEVTFELADDLENAMESLAYESERTGITLDDNLVTALNELLQGLDAAPSAEESLDTDPVWTAARITAARLLTRVQNS